MKGNLIIRPLSANLTRNTDILNRMDPYVKFSLGGQVRQSNIAYGAGKTPGWTDELSFTYNNEDLLVVEVWDKDKTGRDDMVGSASIAFATIQKRGGIFNDWLELNYKGKDAGRILLDIKFLGGGSYGMMPTGGMQQTYPQQTYPQQTYPQQSYPQQTIPQQSYPQQSFPQQTYQQPVYQQGGMPQQTYPQQTYPQQTIPQQGFPQQQGYDPRFQQQQPGYQQGGYQQPGYQQGGFKHY